MKLRWLVMAGVAVMAVGCGQTMEDPGALSAPGVTASTGGGSGAIATADSRRHSCDDRHPLEVYGRGESVCMPAPAMSVDGNHDEEGYNFKFSVKNNGCHTIRKIVLFQYGETNSTLAPTDTTQALGQSPSIGIPVLCPVRDNKCVAKVVHSQYELDRCSFTLGAGDDFGCNVELEVPAVKVVAVGKIDGDGYAFDSADTEIRNDCGRPTEPEFNMQCGGDPTYRFYVKNHDYQTIRNLQIFTDGAGPGHMYKLCPDGDGGCDKIRVNSGDFTSHPECNFVLGSHDDFACRAEYPNYSLHGLLVGTNDKGYPFQVSDFASCDGGMDGVPQ
jgi:hypothetical protein